MAKYRAVFVSPHLDDAVFSCGGTIAKLVSEGPVLVLNVFSGYPADVNRGTVVITQKRYEEEAKAASLLGFKPECLDEVDAALRHDVYRAPAKLFRPPVAEDMRRLPMTSAKIDDYLSRIQYDSIYLPLAIGWHVDHVLCHLATRHLHYQANTLFYQDAPYCLIPNATQYRLRELGILGEGEMDRTLTTRPFASEWSETSRYYARMMPVRGLASWPVRLAAPIVVSLYLRGLLAEHRKLRQQKDAARKLKSIVRNVSDFFSRKIEACYQYDSQIREFFADRQDCLFHYRRYSSLMGERMGSSGSETYERFWRFEDAATGGDR
jgi:LmbE family N-acetylglucosaminyl deacetylase